eukprot:557773-Pleurochrysis_carterae.AAC.8
MESMMHSAVHLKLASLKMQLHEEVVRLKYSRAVAVCRISPYLRPVSANLLLHIGRCASHSRNWVNDRVIESTADAAH